MTDNKWGTTLTYRDKTWGERPASFDVEKLEELYSIAQRFGSEHATSVEFWERRSNAPGHIPPSVVFFNTFSRAIQIEVDRDQDLLDLLVHLAPLGTAAMLDLVLGSDGDMLVRAAVGDEDARSSVARKKHHEEEARRGARKDTRDKKPT